MASSAPDGARLALALAVFGSAAFGAVRLQSAQANDKTLPPLSRQVNQLSYKLPDHHDGSMEGRMHFTLHRNGDVDWYSEVESWNLFPRDYRDGVLHPRPLRPDPWRATGARARSRASCSAPSGPTIARGTPTTTTRTCVATRVGPAGAYTVQHPDADTILISSKRLHADHVRATMHIGLHRNGAVEWWADVHNAASARRAEYTVGAEIRFARQYITWNISSGQRWISDEDYDTIGPRPGLGTIVWTAERPAIEVRDHWDDLKAGFQAEFRLEANNRLVRQS